MNRPPVLDFVLVMVMVMILLAPQARSANIAIDTVLVDNPANAPDQNHGPGQFGAVDHSYRIGTTEVTNAQYTAFLTAKAVSDPFSLYNPGMGSDGRGGIARSGSDGSYSYAVRPNMGNKPVNFVGFYDSIRFANWLNNGQGNGDTENGAYSLGQLDGTGVPINGGSIARNATADWFVTSENEWYKAAYYDPTLNSNTGGYWTYATQNNSLPVEGTANSSGDINNPGPNVANYLNGAVWNGQQGNVTTVGSAGPLSDSFYGTFDQTGNVWEWNEQLFGSSGRGARGGSWCCGADYLPASTRGDTFATDERDNIGFRVASVPEPGSLVLATFGLVGLLLHGWHAGATRSRSHRPRLGRGSACTGRRE